MGRGLIRSTPCLHHCGRVRPSFAAFVKLGARGPQPQLGSRPAKMDSSLIPTAFPVSKIFPAPRQILSVPPTNQPPIRNKHRTQRNGSTRAISATGRVGRKNMLSVHTENIGEMAVIECEGRIVRSEAAFKLRNAVNLQSDARMIVLDLSEVTAIEGGGLGMLVFLERWAHDHDIRLKLFNPRRPVRARLERASSLREFDIATLDEMMALLACADQRYTQAA